MTNKSNKKSGLNVPVIGVAHPKGSTIRRLPNGRIEIVEPGKKKKK